MPPPPPPLSVRREHGRPEGIGLPLFLIPRPLAAANPDTGRGEARFREADTEEEGTAPTPSNTKRKVDM